MIKFLIIFFYNLCFPIGFCFFLPGMIYKLIMRPGYKKNFPERFAIFSKRKKLLLKKNHNGIWIHAVSVGETVVAISFIRHWQKKYPNQKFVLSTTTTTGQEIARKKAPDRVVVIYCPIDFYPFIEITFSIIRPSLLLIFETEIWPNMVLFAKSHGIKLGLINGRMSDKSFQGYRKFKFFFSHLLRQFDIICVQSEEDKERFSQIYGNGDTYERGPEHIIHITGNLKFDQNIPDDLQTPKLDKWFGQGNFLFILGASTHPGEEFLIAKTYLSLLEKYKHLRLILVPRHVERSGEIEKEIEKLGIAFCRKTSEYPNTGNGVADIRCLLVDTTGELLAFIKASDIVIMGKSLAGHTEGHNLIEPALLAKPIVTGKQLSNFKAIFKLIKDADAVKIVETDDKLKDILEILINNEALRKELGRKAFEIISENRGAIEKTIKLLKQHSIPATK